MNAPGRRLALVLLLAAGTASAEPAPRPEFPQVKIDLVDATNPSDWRVVVTALGEGGAPMALAEQPLSLFLAKGHGQVRLSGETPLARFVDGRADKGFRGKLFPLEKAPVAQAAILVVGLHSGVPGDVWRVLGKAVPGLLKGLRPDAKVGVILYGDAVSVLWSPDGKAVFPRDINDFNHCLKSMRAGAARASPDAAEGVDCGGLFAKPALLEASLKSLPAPQGLFPRFLGIPEGQSTLDAATGRGHFRLDSADPAFVGERFAGGALEAALRLLMAGSEPGTLRDVVVVSDGKDGYLGAADLAGDRVSRECLKVAKACVAPTRARRPSSGAPAKPGSALAAEGLEAFEGASKDCTREVLECSIPKVAAAMKGREATVRDHLAALVGAYRAAGIRITALGIPGTDDVGAGRLGALAVRTGGTFRPVAGTNAMQGAADQAARELAGRVILRPGRSLDAEGDYTAVVVTGPNGSLVSPEYRFSTGPRVRPWAGPYAAARGFAIRKLGHSWGPVVLWIVLVLGTVMALLFLYGMGKAVVALVKSLGKPKMPKRPPAPKMPQMKRPKMG